MAEYEYQAESRTGEITRGVINAANDASARHELEARGLVIRSLHERPAIEEPGTLHDEELVTLVHAVGSAAQSRLPVELALAVLAEEQNDPHLASVATRLSARLQEGVPLDKAVAEFEHELPADVRGLMRAGTESNGLAASFERYAVQRVQTQRIHRQIRAAMAYPVLVLAILVPLLLFLSVYVVPMFAELYEDFDLGLPAATELILQTAEQTPGLIAGLLLLVIAVPIILRVLGGRWLFHRFRTATPLIGRLWMWSGQREFASLLASFLEDRIPLIRAVTFTGDLLSDRNIARSCRRIAERLESGETLSACLGQSINFDRSLVAMTKWGESHEVLPDALRIAAEVFDDRINQHVFLVRRLMPPIALITVGSLMIFVLVGLFIPLVKLIESLSM